MNSRFKKNPITVDNRLKAMSKYVYFHSITYFKKNVIHNGIGGIKFTIQKGDSGLVGNIYYGVYELNESMFTAHFLRENDYFLDIGANLGHYSLIASGLTKANAIAIEPIPSTFNKLLVQIKNNKLENKIETLNIGLSNVKSKLYFTSDNEDMNHIVDKNYPNAIEINVDSLDAITLNKSISLLKIDVEGYEKFVFEGGSETLKNTSLKALIVELNNSGARYNVTDDELFEILLNYGFLPYQYQPLTREIIPLESYNKNQFNTIFIRDLEFVKKRILESKKYKIWNKEV